MADLLVVSSRQKSLCLFSVEDGWTDYTSHKYKIEHWMIVWMVVPDGSSGESSIAYWGFPGLGAMCACDLAIEALLRLHDDDGGHVGECIKNT